MAVTMTVDDIRSHLNKPEAIPERAFEILQTLCSMANGDSHSPVLQELVLRALENREYFAEVELVLNGLARISHQGDTGLKFQAPTGSNTARTV